MTFEIQCNLQVFTRYSHYSSFSSTLSKSQNINYFVRNRPAGIPMHSSGCMGDVRKPNSTECRSFTCGILKLIHFISYCQKVTVLSRIEVLKNKIQGCV